MKRITAECTDVAAAIKFIESVLTEGRLTQRDLNQALLISEEIAAKVWEMDDVSKIKVTVAEQFGECSVRFSFISQRPFELDDEDEEDIGGKILHYYGEKLKFRYSSGTNTVTVLAGQTYTRYLRFSAIAFGAAILFCILMFLLVSDENRRTMLTEVVWPLESVFAKAVCMLATPVTFFCIVSNVAGYSNLMDRYPDVRRLIMRYVATSVVAIAIGYGIGRLLQPIALNFGTLEEFHVNSETTLNFSSVWSAVSSIVPDNILSPFSTSDTLPMLFLAVISGISVGIIDRQSGKCKEFMDMLRDFFCKMLYIVFEFGAVMVFLCFTDVILYSGWTVLLYLLYLLLSILLVLLVLNLFYLTNLGIHRITPKEIFPLMQQCFRETFRIGSSVDAIPNTLRRCTEKMGFPKRPLEVSIPLGANMNMDGNCAVLMILMPVIGLINGVELTLVEAAVMGLTILIMSLGAPNQPGSLTVAAMILLPQMGLTEEVITVTIIIELITCRLLAASNVLGDIVSSKIVGEQERRRVSKQRQMQEKS